MSFRGMKAVLLACGGIGALLAVTADANAGGFAVREQSAWGQGTSFAGVAAGGDLSAMFWNPATMTQMPGLQSESVLSGIVPYASNSADAGATFAGLGGTGDTAHGRIGAGQPIIPGSSDRICGSACRSIRRSACR